MPYVCRDKLSKVVSISLHSDDEETEQLSIDHPDVIDFLTRAGHDDSAKNLLDDYDTEIPRIVEDLIDILIRNKLISFDEFPLEARHKMITRQYLRNLIRQVSRSS